ncbi:MAG: hypothetical protein CR960_00580 [Pasteurellales bacterium]|nr:MAG: hypothetical protein CR960_00580 [Pasteurellales bacterium]
MTIILFILSIPVIALFFVFAGIYTFLPAILIAVFGVSSFYVLLKLLPQVFYISVGISTLALFGYLIYLFPLLLIIPAVLLALIWLIADDDEVQRLQQEKKEKEKAERLKEIMM